MPSYPREIPFARLVCWMNEESKRFKNLTIVVGTRSRSVGERSRLNNLSAKNEEPMFMPPR